MSLGAVVGFKVYDYLVFNSQNKQEECSYDEYSDVDSVFEEQLEFHIQNPVRSEFSCDSDSSGLDEHENQQYFGSHLVKLGADNGNAV